MATKNFPYEKGLTHKKAWAKNPRVKIELDRNEVKTILAALAGKEKELEKKKPLNRFDEMDLNTFKKEIKELYDFFYDVDTGIINRM